MVLELAYNANIINEVLLFASDQVNGSEILISLTMRTVEDIAFYISFTVQPLILVVHALATVRTPSIIKGQEYPNDQIECQDGKYYNKDK